MASALRGRSKFGYRSDQQKTDEANKAALDQLSTEEIEELSGLEFGLFGASDTSGLPTLPGTIGPDTDVAGQVSIEDRNRMRKMKRMQKSFSGRQGTILGGGVPTQAASTSQSKSVLGM